MRKTPGGRRDARGHEWILAAALCAGACGGDEGTRLATVATMDMGGGPGSGGAGAGQRAPSVAGASGAPDSRGVGGASALGGAGAGGGSAAVGGAGTNAQAGSGGAGTSAQAGSSGASGTTERAGSGGQSGVSGTPAADGGGAGASATPAKKFCGNITTAGRVRPDFGAHWDQLTPEHEGKWGSVERQRDQMNWSGLDAAYAYAKAQGIPFKQHTFVWGSQQPDWLTGLPQAEQRAEVEEWIRLYCERFPDTQLIDVVNEPPPHTNPPYAAALGGAGRSGYDWIVQSFKWARQYCPKAVLMLNDYNTIEYGNDNTRFIDIVKRIQAAGAPIDAVGVQAHDAFKIPTDTVKQFIDKLVSETGLPVYVSEYDIDLADDNQQKTVMESQFTMFWEHPRIAGVTLWGYVEGQTWRPNTGLMSDGGQPRPALEWLMNYLKR